MYIVKNIDKIYRKYTQYIYEYLHNITRGVAPNVGPRSHNQGGAPLTTQHLINHINNNNQYINMGPPPHQGPLLLSSTITPCPTSLNITNILTMLEEYKYSPALEAL